MQSEGIIVITIVAAVLGGLGTLLFSGPAAAWRSVFKTVQEQQVKQAERIAVLEKVLVKKEEEVQHRDNVIRRLREYLAVMQSVLHHHGIEVPHPPQDYVGDDIAHERRSATVVSTYLDSPPTHRDHEGDHHGASQADR